MTWRFPLYAKILLWFFLNLLLLATAFLVVLRVQFASGFDWLLAAGAGQRIQSLCDLIESDLAERPRNEWDSVLQRFSDSHQLQFLLFDNTDGAQLAGDRTLLPPAVQSRIAAFRGPGSRLLRGDMPDRFPLHERRERSPGVPGMPRGENPKHVVRTSNPTRYWMLVRVAVQGAGMARPLPATVVIVSRTLSAGGLFLDFKPWLAVGCGVMLLSGLLWLPLVRSLTQSIGQMTRATGQIAEGRFDGRVDECRRDELGLLGRSINRMAARLSGFVIGQKRFLGDIAHELCAPLARTQVALGILEQRAEEKTKPYLEDLREEVQHMSNLVNELLSFSRASLSSGTIELKPVLLRNLAEEAIQRESPEGGKVGLDIAADVSALAEPELLARALANLLRNAIRYAGQAGPITVSARREGREVLLSVIDSGAGVPETELARIFDPFYRLDASRDAATGGVGLGLAIVKTCVECCRGTVSCRNLEPTGFEVTLKLATVN